MTLKSGVKVIESYTSEFLTRHFLLVITCNRGHTLYRLWDVGPPSLYFATLLRFTSPMEGFGWNDLR